MAIETHRENQEQHSFTSFSQWYFVRDYVAPPGTPADISAEQAVAAAITAFNTDFPLFIPNNYQADRRSTHSFRVAVTFEAKDGGPLTFPDPYNFGTLRTRFNHNARQRVIRRSLETVSAHSLEFQFSGASTQPGPGETWTDLTVEPFGKLMNVDQDGPTWFTVTPPSPNYTREYTFERTDVTDTYINLLADLCRFGTMNNATFLGRDPGEVLLVQCVGGLISDTTYQLSFGFAVEPNETDLNAGGGIIIPTKLGHHYVWTADIELWDTFATGSFTTHKPIMALVERIYHQDDLNKIFVDPTNPPTEEL